MVDPTEPAFPRDHRFDGHNGMTLRDYVAIKIVAACMATASNLGEGTKEMRRAVFNQVAEISLEVADSYLAAREVK